jgi:hypothetical protein
MKSLALIDHYRIVRGALYKRLGAASEAGDGNSLAALAGRLHENLRDCGRLTGELQRGPLLNIQNNLLVNPDYTKAIIRIVSAVARYRETPEAVIAALRDLDAGSAPAPALADQRSEGDIGAAWAARYPIWHRLALGCAGSLLTVSTAASLPRRWRPWFRPLQRAARGFF